MFRKHYAAEQHSFEQGLALLGDAEVHLKKILARLERIAPRSQPPSIADIGAGQGLFLIACARSGLKAVGVEPWEQARATAERLAEHEGLSITILPGTAEDMPLPDAQFDIVNAHAVIEHVRDPQAAFGEVWRVLKPGGVFWFCATSSLCPRQLEIAAFPCFSWYPDRLKRRIMEWARTHKPHLIGHTQTPAINWFTPAKARRMLGKAGFRQVYDRWDLRIPSEGDRLHAIALRIIRLCGCTKFIADVLVKDCSYAAVK